MEVYPYFLDLIFVGLLVTVLEPLVLQANYRVLSPVALFVTAFFALYIMPFYVHVYIERLPRYESLSNEEIALAIGRLREFFYTWCGVTMLALAKVRRLRPHIIKVHYPRLTRRVWIIFTLFVASIVMQLGVGVGFAPSLMVERAINPRAYTYLAEGLGPVTHLAAGLRYLMLAISSILLVARRGAAGTAILFLTSAVLSILGGSKSSIVLPFVVLVVVWQCMTVRRQSLYRRMFRAVLLVAIGGGLVVAGFVVFGQPGQKTAWSEAIARIPAYHHEAYYLPLVTSAFPWSPERASTVITDTLLVPIPRAFWKEKPALGIWARYFRPTFEPMTESYHTSTFGCLAEAHILFGRAGPVVYGLLFALMTFWLYKIIVQPEDLLSIYIAAIMGFWLYLLMRTGFLGTNASLLAIYFILGRLLLRGTSVSRAEREFLGNSELKRKMEVPHAIV